MTKIMDAFKLTIGIPGNWDYGHHLPDMLYYINVII